MMRLSVCAVASVAIFSPVLAMAAADPPTPAFVIFMADGLEEQDGPGYYLNTAGPGQSDRLHLHSCKPRGGDVQFRYDPATSQIESHAFPGQCADVTPAGPVFALLPCSASVTQKFRTDLATGEIGPLVSPELCLGASENTRKAGPFLARDLAWRPVLRFQRL